MRRERHRSHKDLITDGVGIRMQICTDSDTELIGENRSASTLAGQFYYALCTTMYPVNLQAGLVILILGSLKKGYVY